MTGTGDTQRDVEAQALTLEDRVDAARQRVRPAGSARAVWTVVVLAAAVAAGAFGVAPLMAWFGADPQGGAADGAEKTQYTCGMHPEIVQDEPGTCPVCGMKLTPMRSNGPTEKVQLTGVQACAGREILHYQAPMDPEYTSPEPGKSPMGMDLVPVCEGDEEVSAGGIHIDSRIRQNMGIRTVKAHRGPLRKPIRTVGHVDYDERRIAVITTKVDGWVEGLRVDFTGQAVKQGTPLFQIYSPQLISTQEELLSALRQYRRTNTAVDLRLLDAARRRLAYWDISQAQIAALEESGVAQRTLTIESPIDGVVVHKNVFDGKHVRAGVDLFRIADLSRVWVYAHLYEMDVPFVKLGAEAIVRLPYVAGPPLTGRVDYVFPWLEPKTRDVKARLVFDNPDGRLKPEMYVHIDVEADLGEEALLVDSSAVIRSGVRNVLFVEMERGTFEPRMVELGRELESTIEILSGVEEGEAVVINGQFMLDSESRLTEALQKFGRAENEQDQWDAVTSLEHLQGGGCTHTCSMPEHFHSCGKGAGKCPECGMTMVEVEGLLQEHRARDTGTGAEPTITASVDERIDALAAKDCTHTCPMTVHLHICAGGPGECPECGMSLRTLDEARTILTGDGGAQPVPATPLEKLDARAAQGCTHTCPMPMHFDVCGEEEGPCPKCGMALKPLDALRPRFEPKPATPLEKLDARAAQGCTHTCPMPMHFDVCGEEAGPCPKCGMALKPLDALRPRFEGQE